METFPNEGKIDISLLDKDVIEKIEKFISSGRTNTSPKSKNPYTGISWTNNNYWYLTHYKSGGRTEYTYNQISKFIEPKSEFKKGDYIVLTAERNSKAFIINYCYKQRENFVYIRPELDSKGADDNGMSGYGFPDSNWRYATQQEVAEYNRISKPYDVTTLKSVELTHENLQDDTVYHVALKDDYSTSYLVKKNSPNYVILHRKLVSVGFYHSDSYKYQLATEEQIQHYNNCVQAGKYVEPNTIKSIEPWSVGTYVVITDSYHSVKIGDVHYISNVSSTFVDITKSVGSACLPFKDKLKWFATKNEAELFAKTLVEVKHEWNIGDAFEVIIDRPNSSELETGIVYYIYRVDRYDILASLTKGGKPLECGYVDFKYMKKPEPTKVYDYEVVHCINQSEWDFVRSKTTTNYSKNWDDAIRNYQETGICIQTDGNGWCDYNWYKSENSKIYTFKEWCNMNNYTFESHKFEVGKWYKQKGSSFIIKYLRTQPINANNRNVIIYSDIIDSFQKYKSIPEGSAGVGYEETIGWYELTDLTEIQQYLPEGHVDKIKSEYVPQVGDWVVVLEGKSRDSETFKGQCKKVTEVHSWYIEIEGGKTGLNISSDGYSPEFRKAQPYEIPVTKQEHQLEVGKYYTVNDNDGSGFIMICKITDNTISINNGALTCKADIISTLKNTELFNSNSVCAYKYEGTNRTYRESTSDEIEWLDRCISANKFVPKELSKDELLEIAKSKYPVGTKFKPCHVETECIIEITAQNFNFQSGLSFIVVNGNNFKYIKKDDTINELSPCLYDNGKWAEIVDKPTTTSFSTDFKWESKSPANIMAQRMNINSAYGIMNGGNPCNEIVLPNSTMDIPRLTTENTTDEILKILNQYMEIEILDTMEEVVLPQLLKSKSLLTIK